MPFSLFIAVFLLVYRRLPPCLPPPFSLFVGVFGAIAPLMVQLILLITDDYFGIFFHHAGITTTEDIALDVGTVEDVNLRPDDGT